MPNETLTNPAELSAALAAHSPIVAAIAELRQSLETRVYGNALDPQLETHLPCDQLAELVTTIALAAIGDLARATQRTPFEVLDHLSRDLDPAAKACVSR